MTAAHAHSPEGSTSRLQALLRHDTTAGLVLVVAAALAIAAYNQDGLRPLYEGFLETKFTVAFGDTGLSKPALLWINDGLMAIFFFLVGLELKREVLEGNLSSRDQIVLPAIAAVGGMAAPALIYTLVNLGHPDLLRGWAIPAATDIAFALGALSLAGRRVPPALKVFLLTLATLDDLGAIVIIALFYTAELSMLSLALTGVSLVILFVMNRLHVGRTAPYVFVGLVMWVCVLKSGVHATLDGVALAFMIPLRRRDGSDFVHELEEALQPYVKFFILPLFAFANAGIPLDGFNPHRLAESLPLGIAAGLALGKPLGIIGAIALATRQGLARLPEGCTWRHVIGVGCLAGIGFTMSLFIGSLAFESHDLATSVRVGVIAGSLVSTILGVTILVTAPAATAAPETLHPSAPGVPGDPGDA
ncbi:MAG: Na+/H+ antiporter NhaA [Candidatus Binatia bacterium]